MNLAGLILFKITKLRLFKSKNLYKGFDFSPH